MTAPVELEPLLAFVNTVDFEGERDWLAGWLGERGLGTSPGELEQARAVREALRALLLAHNGVDVGLAEAGETLAEASRRARLELRAGADGPQLVAAAGGLEGELGALLAVVAAAVADGSWSRLKACRAETCRWAFYDAARNRSRRWCSMAVCGNRTKARTYRERARRKPSAPAAPYELTAGATRPGGSDASSPRPFGAPAADE
jgi:predicted RNA-binding Zn ribbon-like protein